MTADTPQGEVYIVEEEDSGRIKIGYAADTSKRLRQLQTGNSHDLALRATIRIDDESARALEALLHMRFSDHRLRGEWFQIDWHVVKAVVPEELERFQAMSGIESPGKTASLPVWCIHPRRDHQTLKVFLNKGLIGLGFGHLGDLSKIVPSLEAFREAWEKRNPDMSPGQTRAFYPMLYSFACRVAIGDLIVFPTTWADRNLHVGRITGPYQYKRWVLHGYQDLRPVKWVASLQRETFSSEALRGLQVNLAFFRVQRGEFLNELDTAMRLASGGEYH